MYFWPEKNIGLKNILDILNILIWVIKNEKSSVKKTIEEKFSENALRYKCI